MQSSGWILTDSSEKVWEEDWKTSASNLGLEGKQFTVEKTTLKVGMSQGVDAIEVNNGDLTFTILPTRGMSIWKGSYRGLHLGWEAPIAGPVHPHFVDLLDRSGLGWLQGFDEWIVRCGLGFNGAPGNDVVLDNNGNPCEVFLNLHGKIANLPAHFVEVRIELEEPYTITVAGHVNESMLFSPRLQLRTQIKTWPNSNRLVIEDLVVNRGGTSAEFELLYHCNFGAPFLGDGSRLVAPLKAVYPRDSRAAEDMDAFARYAAPTAGFVEQVYWLEAAADESDNTLALLKDPDGTNAVAVRFNQRELPSLTLWKNTAALEDGYVTGIEPGTDYPNCRPFEREKGRLATLAPGESFQCQVGIEIADSPAAISRLEEEVASIREDAPRVSSSPHPDLSVVE